MGDCQPIVPMLRQPVPSRDVPVTSGVGLSVNSLRRSGTSGVGGEADMPRSLLNRREWTRKEALVGGIQQ